MTPKIQKLTYGHYWQILDRCAKREIARLRGKVKGKDTAKTPLPENRHPSIPE